MNTGKQPKLIELAVWIKDPLPDAGHRSEDSFLLLRRCQNVSTSIATKISAPAAMKHNAAMNHSGPSSGKPSPFLS
jgi:hypothetical protein